LTIKNPLVVWVSDLHINSTVALCAPEVQLDDGGYHRVSREQDALWLAWVDAWKTVRKQAGKRPVTVIFGGEIADKDAKSRSTQFITKNPDTIVEIAMDTLKPALEVGSQFIVLRGTEAHTGKSSNLDETIAKNINERHGGVVRNEKTGRYSWWYGRFYIGGRLFDLAHHTSMGSLPWTERNAANKLAAMLVMDYALQKEPFPDFALRGHVHRVADSSMNYPIRAVIGPSWELHTSYSHRIGRGSQAPEIGLIVIDPAPKTVEWMRYEADVEKPTFVS